MLHIPHLFLLLEGLLDARSPVLGPLLQVDVPALGLELLVLVPLREAGLQPIILRTAGVDHLKTAVLAALFKLPHFRYTFLRLGPISHYLGNQDLGFYLAQGVIIWVAWKMELRQKYRVIRGLMALT